MALTKAKVREILSAAGVDKEHMSDAVENIIDGHLASINVLREEADKYKADAEKLQEVQKELDGLKGGEDWKAKYNQVKKDFDDYKAAQTAKESRTAKEAAVRAYLESKNIKDGNLAIAMRGLSAEIDAAQMDGDKLKDTAELDALIAGDFKGLVTTTTEKGAPPPANPPKGPGGTMTKADIYKKDDKGRYVLSTAERQKAIAENHEQFGI